MASATKTALITGIRGFTGRYMANELLTAGYQVIGLGATPFEESNYYQADLRDVNTLREIFCTVRPNIIVHLAAISFVAHDDANSLYQVNLLGTRNLLEALTLAKIPLDAILLASSANVYGNASSGILYEDSLPSPTNDYAVSKLAMEYMAKAFNPTLPIIITRPFNYTGLGQENHFLIPKIVEHFRTKSSAIELGNLDIKRDFGDVRSVVQAYRLLLETPKAVGQILNVCTGITHSLRDVIALCSRMTGHMLEVRANPSFMRRNEVKMLSGNPTKLRNLLNNAWTPNYLPDTLEWMLKN